MAGIGEAATIIAVVQATAQVASLCGGYLSGVLDAQKDIQRLYLGITSLQGVLEKVEQMVTGSKSAELPVSDSVHQSLKQCLTDLEDLKTKLDPGKRQKAMKRIGLRALKWPFTRKEIDQTVQMLEGYTTTFSVALQADQISIMLGIDGKFDRAQQDRLLAALPCVDNAAFNSYDNQHERKCLPNTRVDLRRLLTEWVDSNSSKCIFWLNGMAGTGKSTIARTMADHFASENRLMASFFFSKGRGDRGHARHFFSTIAVQMARALPSIRTYICEAIDEQPGIAQQAMLEQWNKLILQPLRKMKYHQPLSRPMVFVIDALDECSNQEDIRLILRLLADSTDLTTLKLRVFVTSRSETPIRLGFRDISRIMYEDLALQHVSQSAVEADIHTFFEYELGRIRRNRNLPPGWPHGQKVKLLVQKANCLFIYAATACLYIGGALRASPETSLSNLILGEVADTLSTRNLDEMYLQILRDSVAGEYSDTERRDLVDQFQRVVGSIVVLFDALSVSALSQLATETLEIVNVTLDPLHSVLSIPPDTGSPISLLHPSFRDFLLSPDRCSDDQFRVDAKLAHASLARNCLGHMFVGLKENICGLQSPGSLTSDIEEGKLICCVPSSLQYACRYWVEHLQWSESQLYDEGQVHLFLRQHLLHWLEALSLIGKMSEGVHAIFLLESMVRINESPRLYSFIHDAKRFLLYNRSIIEVAPLQIYWSALIFAPQQSLVRMQFENEIPSRIKVSIEGQYQWSSLLQTLEGHTDWVSAVAFSPDGKTVASTSSDKTVRLWDAATGAALQTLEGHTETVSKVAFSPDGKTVASASSDKTVRLWDAATGTALQTLEGHTETVRVVAFSPDGKMVASASLDKTVRLWDPATGTALQTLEGHTDWVSAVTFSPDGKTVASASGDETVRLWDAATGAALQTLEGHRSLVRAVAFSPDGKTVASASHDGTVRLWDTTTGTALQTLKGHTDYISAVSFSPDGKTVASASLDRTVRLWDTATGTALQTLKGHTDWVSAVAFSPDGKTVASASGDKTVQLWDTAMDTALQTLKGHTDCVSAVAFSPDGKTVASASGDKTVRLWDTAAGATLQTLEGHTDSVSAVAFSPDDKTVASTSGDDTIRLWDTTAGVTLQTLEGHTDSVNAIAFSPDGKTVASYDRTVRLWDAATGAALQTLEGHRWLVNAVAFSPDGKTVASASLDRTVRLWDTATGAALQTLEGHMWTTNAVAFSPDGKTVASASDDGTVLLWDMATGAILQTLEGHTNRVYVIAFSLDSKTVAASSYETVRLWDAATGAALQTLEANRWSVNAVAFSPDSKTVASASDDKTVRLWDTATGTALQALEGHADYISAVAFSPDGKMVASASLDKTVRLWDTATGAALQTFENCSIDCLVFSRNGSCLETNRGFLYFQFDSASSLAPKLQPLFLRGNWLTQGERSLIWLPFEYRPTCSAFRDNLLLLGHASGKITFIKSCLL